MDATAVAMDDKCGEITDAVRDWNFDKCPFASRKKDDPDPVVKGISKTVEQYVVSYDNMASTATKQQQKNIQS